MPSPTRCSRNGRRNDGRGAGGRRSGRSFAPAGLGEPAVAPYWRVMTTAELQDLFLSTLVKEVGGNRRRWRLALGAVKLYPVATHPHCNWSVTPSGGEAEIAAVERIADDLRVRYPIVTG